MKKLYFLLLITIVTGCSKSSQSPYTTYTITYSISVNTNTAFELTYFDGNGNPVDVNYTGTSWSQTVTTNQSTNFKAAQFTINDPSRISDPGLPAVTGTATISISGKNPEQDAINFGNNGYASLAMTYPLFN